MAKGLEFGKCLLAAIPLLPIVTQAHAEPGEQKWEGGIILAKLFGNVFN